jgi:hypothetical protein
MSRSVLVVLVGAVAAFGAAFGIARAASGGGGGRGGSDPATAAQPHVVRSSAAHPAIASVSLTAVPQLRHKRRQKSSPQKRPIVTGPTPQSTTPKPTTSTPPAAVTPRPQSQPKKKKPQPFE